MTPAIKSKSSFRQQCMRATHHGDRIFWLVTLLFALVLLAMIGLIIVVTFSDSGLARGIYGPGFLVQNKWNPTATQNRPEMYGAWPAVYGTVTTSVIAVLCAAPIGISAGVFLSEMCPKLLRMPISILIELLAAIPSVIYGLWGRVVFIPVFNEYFVVPVTETLGQFIPWLAAPMTMGQGIFVTGVVLGIMILPTITAITHDVVKVVPQSQREVLLAIGATRWEVIWQGVLPYAFAGILGGVMLGLGRALGETMAAIMLIGNNIAVNESLFSPGTTSAALIANQLVSASGPLHHSSLIYLALILFSITFLVNLFARVLVWRISRDRT